jgi:hypothetical protein
MKYILLTILTLFASEIYGQELLLGSYNDSSAIVKNINNEYLITVRGYSFELNRYVDVRTFKSKDLPKSFHEMNEKDVNGDYYMVSFPKMNNNNISFKNDVERYKNNMMVSGYTIVSETESTGGYRLMVLFKTKKILNYEKIIIFSIYINLFHCSIANFNS